MFKNALVSVSNKAGLLEFLKPLQQKGLRIVSTGGTYQFLKENGLNVIEISAQTDFPEVMGGRVKTLHPKVHMALLSREGNPDDEKILNQFQLEKFDLLICNLYPFEESVMKGLTGSDLIEKIDIGGPSMLRSAAKNFERLTVICDPTDYEWILNRKSVGIEERKKLAAKVFAHTSSYDSLISRTLDSNIKNETTLAGKKVQELRYGENPQQKAFWFQELANSNGLHSAKVLQGKELSYNNILDIDAAVSLLKEFKMPTVVAVKHNNPCGVAQDMSPQIALEKAILADPVSVFGGILALNFEVNEAVALKLNEVFLECVVALDFTTEAMHILGRKKNLRVLHWPQLYSAEKNWEYRSITGGFLIQSSDSISAKIEEWNFLDETPDISTKSDLIFSEKVCAALKSNAIAIVKNLQTIGLGMGQVNRVEAVRHAIERMQHHHKNISGAILASDAFFPFPDSIEIAAKAGIKWILQPGGSVKDEEVIKTAQKLGVKMVLTGNRHFRH
jgi:phosphoribosylaminoimidazolecarboxamide formyltransferase/IMP cyclohydrolase